MGFRVPSPDGRKNTDNLPVLVLPDDTVLKDTYKVKYLGAGGMSIVYTGVKNGEKLFFKEAEGRDSKKVIALSQEKATLERLKHPGIVKAYDFFEEDGFYYLVTEFIEGSSLDRQISPISGVFLQEKVLQDWAMQLYDIFIYLHSQNPPIIFRDLKPQNIVKDREGKLHLVDFGIARVYKDYKSSDTLSMGTKLTASPEHYGGRQTDERSDIYTLGATLHFMATNGKGGGEELFEFPPLRSINGRLSESFEAVVRKATEIEPSKRFQTVAEMRDAHLGKGREVLREKNGSTMTISTETMAPDRKETPPEVNQRSKGTPSISIPIPHLIIAVLLIAILIVTFAAVRTAVLSGSREASGSSPAFSQAAATPVQQYSAYPSGAAVTSASDLIASTAPPAVEASPSTVIVVPTGSNPGNSPHYTQAVQTIVTASSSAEPYAAPSNYPMAPPRISESITSNISSKPPLLPGKGPLSGIREKRSVLSDFLRLKLKIPQSSQYLIGDTGASVTVPDGYLEFIGIKAMEKDISNVTVFFTMGDTTDTMRELQFHTATPSPEKMKGFFSRGFVKEYRENHLIGEKNMTVREESLYHNRNISGYRFVYEGPNNKMKMYTMNVQIIVPDKNRSSLIFLTTSVQQQFYPQYERELEGFFNSLTL
ncbi:MAG: serine/threonine protein kinase [Vulcanimicrobiota bacterium]